MKVMAYEILENIVTTCLMFVVLLLKPSLLVVCGLGCLAGVSLFVFRALVRRAEGRDDSELPNLKKAFLIVYPCVTLVGLLVCLTPVPLVRSFTMYTLSFLWVFAALHWMNVRQLGPFSRA